jgi:hypothetical protein
MSELGMTVGVVVAGMVTMAIGYATRQRRGRPLLALGGALVVGSVSPLTRGWLDDAARIVFSALAVALAATGVAIALHERRGPSRTANP